MKFKLMPVAGDASFREFYRLITNKKNIIIIIAKREKYKNLVVYSAINTFLRSNKILAPKLYFTDYSKGVIAIEDFGDLTFHKLLLKSRNKLSIYKKLVELLIKIQKIKPKKKINSFLSKAYTIKKYTKHYLHQESDLFFDWYLPLILKKKKVLSIKMKAKKILSKIYKKLNFKNSYLVHRDFHVQNLMKVGKNIGILDSQDALIGNPSYDLVSLIDDVRIKSSKDLKKKIYNYYLKKSPINKIKSQQFLEDFNILSVQRSLKIIGIFSRLFKRDKKRQFLKLIPYTWKLLENRMDSKIFLELKKILDKNIPKKYRKKIFF